MLQFRDNRSVKKRKGNYNIKLDIRPDKRYVVQNYVYTPREDASVKYFQILDTLVKTQRYNIEILDVLLLLDNQITESPSCIDRFTS